LKRAYDQRIRGVKGRAKAAIQFLVDLT